MFAAFTAATAAGRANSADVDPLRSGRAFQGAVQSASAPEIFPGSADFADAQAQLCRLGPARPRWRALFESQGESAVDGVWIDNQQRRLSLVPPLDWDGDPFADLNWRFKLNAWRPMALMLTGRGFDAEAPGDAGPTVDQSLAL